VTSGVIQRAKPFAAGAAHLEAVALKGRAELLVRDPDGHAALQVPAR
jgi:hypothetical protein